MENDKKKDFNIKGFWFAGTEVALILIIAVLFITFTITTDSFFSTYNLTNILKQSSIAGIIAIASTFVIVSGGMDLSVGSITGLGSLVVALMMQKLKAPVGIILICALLIGAFVGLCNGIIIYYLKIAPFIATLGTQMIIRGIVKLVCNAKTITGVYPKYAEFSSGFYWFLPKMAFIWFTIVVVSMLIFKYTRFGRDIFTVGCSREVAHLSGVNLKKTTIGVYAASGLLCAIAGALLTSRINSAIPTGGSAYEMDAIAAAVLGGASLSGGRGSIVGTFLGTLLMVLISNGGIQLGINSFIMEAITGILIIIAVALDVLRSRYK